MSNAVMTSHFMERTTGLSLTNRGSLKTKLRPPKKRDTDTPISSDQAPGLSTRSKSVMISSENGNSFSVSALCSNEVENYDARVNSPSTFSAAHLFPFSGQETADLHFKEILRKCMNDDWQLQDKESFIGTDTVFKSMISPNEEKNAPSSTLTDFQTSFQDHDPKHSFETSRHHISTEVNQSVFVVNDIQKPKAMWMRHSEEHSDGNSMSNGQLSNDGGRKRRRRYSHSHVNKCETNSYVSNHRQLNVEKSSQPINLPSTETSTSGRLRITIKKFSSAEVDTYRIESTTVKSDRLRDISIIPPTSHSSTTATSVLEDLPDSEEDHCVVVGPSVNGPPVEQNTTTIIDTHGPLPKLRIKMPQQTPQAHPETSWNRKSQSTPQMPRCELPDGRVFEVGDIVWAKIQGYPYWPSRIVRIEKREVPGPKPVSTPKRKPLTKAIHRSTKLSGVNSAKNLETEYHCCVDWLAWNQHSYIVCEKLFHFQEFYHEKFAAKNKSKLYVQAVKEATDILLEKQTASSVSACSVPPSRLAEFLPLKVRIPYNITSTEPFNSYTTLPSSVLLGNSASVNSAATCNASLPRPFSQSPLHFSDNVNNQVDLLSSLNPNTLWSISSNADDLPILSGQLFGEANHTGADVPEFSDDEEINLRKNITETVINL